MGLFNQIFGKKKQPEDYYHVIITPESVTVRYLDHADESVLWGDIKSITLNNTDQGPSAPDIWLVLRDENGGCKIPQGCKGFEEVYEIVSKYEGFNFDNFIISMSTTENAEFLLWSKQQ